jgi:hypothetical protein
VSAATRAETEAADRAFDEYYDRIKETAAHKQRIYQRGWYDSTDSFYLTGFDNAINAADARFKAARNRVGTGGAKVRSSAEKLQTRSSAARDGFVLRAHQIQGDRVVRARVEFASAQAEHADVLERYEAASGDDEVVLGARLDHARHKVAAAREALHREVGRSEVAVE